MSGYVPSMVLLGGLYLEHQKEKLGKRFDADEAWAEFMQFVKNKQADAWDEGYEAAYRMAKGYGHVDHWMDAPDNPCRKQEEA